MSKIKQFALRKDHIFMRMLILFVLPALVIAAITMTASANTIYKINDGGQIIYHTTDATDPAEVLSEAGLVLGADDIYTTADGMVAEITIQRVQMVTIDNGGQILKTGTYGETVESLLSRLDLELDEDDSIDTELTAETFDGMEISIDRRSVVVETFSQPIAFETEYVESNRILEGKEEVVTEGQEGELLCTARVTYVNGVETGRSIIKSERVAEPVNEVVAQGTLVAEPGRLTIGDGVIVTAGGDVYTYTGTMQARATAYTHTDAGCDMITATGTTVHWGTVAVDPRMIPYGTRMFIVSNDGAYVYGLSAAEDCGGSIQGNRIDLYMPTTSECFQFGTRNCTIYFLG